jgi:hypothetical protein
MTEARFYQAPSPDDLRELFDTIATLLRTQYVIAIDASSIPDDEPSLAVVSESDGRLGRGERALPDDFFRPRVRLSGLPSEPVAALMSVRPQISAPRDVALVQYFIGERLVHSTDQAPFELSLDPIDHPVGQHELSVVVTDIRGDRGEARAAIEIASVPPRLNILNAQEGTVIRGHWALELDIKSQTPVASVQVSVGDESLQADERGRFYLDSAAFSEEGPHRLVVLVVDEAGGTAEAALTLELRHPVGGGGGRSPLVILVLGLAAVAATAVLWYRRRRRHREPPVGVITPPPGGGPEPHPEAASAAEPLPSATTPAPRARLTLMDGPDSDERVFVVAGKPVTVGSDPGCTIVLADASGRVAPREVRVWPREDRFMLHRLPRRTSAPSRDQQPVWAVLEDGDEIRVGPYRLVFEILNA